MHTYTHDAHMHVHTHTYMHACTHTHAHVRTHIHTHACINSLKILSVIVDSILKNKNKINLIIFVIIISDWIAQL